MIQRNISQLISTISPRLFYHIAYFHHRGHIANFNDPKNISEIWIKQVLDGRMNSIYYLADKYLVRDYVKERGLGEILIPLIAKYDYPNQLDWSVLPSRFALKANFGAGMNLICTDKDALDESQVRHLLESWLNSPSFNFFENHYNLIDRKIVCEEYIDDGNGGFPVDYKFICIKGTMYCVLVCNGRETGHTNYIPYNRNFIPLFDYCKANHDDAEIMNAPANFEKMIEVAEKLAHGMELVRVDLYSNGLKIWFGEMTLTPDGCIFRRWTQKAIDEMGEYYRKY